MALKTNIVLPPEMLTQNLPNYKKLFSLGENVEGCKHNAVYTAENDIGFLPRQHYVLDMAGVKDKKTNDNNDADEDTDEDDILMENEDDDSDLKIPCWGRHKDGGSDRVYEYTICSYRAIMKTQFKYINMMLRLGIPLHFYADFDMSLKDIEQEEGGPVKNVGGAIKEAIESMKVVIKEEQERTRNPTFMSFDGKFTVSILYGHRDDKESAHVVFHMTGLRMFEDVRHCGYFYYRIVMANNRRYATKKENPLYYKRAKTGEYSCIMDWQVYSKNRMFRHIGQVKQGSKPYPNDGALFPECDSPTMVCTSPTCIYHAYRQIPETDFCANEIRFIPRNSGGVPFHVDKIKMAKIPNPFNKGSWLDAGKEESILTYITRSNTNSISPMFGNKQLSRASGVADTNDNNNNSNVSVVGTVAHPLANVNEIAGQRMEIMSIIAAMLSRKTGYACQAKGCDPRVPNREMGLIMSASRMCLYKGKRECSVYTSNTVKPEQHSSNHIFYNAVIDMPLPLVFVNCGNEGCRAFIESLKDEETRKRVNFERLVVDFSDTDEATQERYRNAVLRYMKNSKINMTFAFVNK